MNYVETGFDIQALNEEMGKLREALKLLTEVANDVCFEAKSNKVAILAQQKTIDLLSIRLDKILGAIVIAKEGN